MRKESLPTANVNVAPESPSSSIPRKRSAIGARAIWQARLALLIMINIAQLWILSGTVEAALAREYKQLLPLVAASVVCWLLALSIFLWWKPVSHDFTSTGYLRKK
jgi:hypothetical protein